ncbi:MAG TPA: DNA-processing protein DprA [Vicinamibacterales bacterium]|nr:DNA-processing protein DprA [Vicinamibacterales bacterium]
MDLLTAVAVSMLPVSRLKAAALFKELRGANPLITLESVLDAVGLAPGGQSRTEALASARRDAQAALTAGADLGMEPVPWFDPRYPPLLTCIPDPPPVLWARGALDCLTRPAVAVVGSRAATPYALQVGRRLAAELAERGIVVVSGLARGVDAAAHEGCLSGGGATVAVTGCGLDRVYPQEHTALARRIEAKGLLLSELGPGAAPRPEHFPLRNRVISGISLAVVVVEASEKSGSLITAACALRQGRDVMAVPGSVLSGRNRGSHSLLKDGAKVVETADDILEELGWAPPAARAPGAETRGRSAKDPLLLTMDPGEAYSLDELVEATGTPAPKLLPRLMELELLGLVDVPASGRFVRR